ncbi:MAG TPA: phage holin family protein [Planctomycetota bacterium]|nr:phage holin family protein [Planctomycetota bacterium]
MKPLCELDYPWKLLISMFLIVLTSGFVVAELYLKHTTELADGKPGLSMDDITITFHGNGVPLLRRKIAPGGSMRKYFSVNSSEEELKPDDLKDIERMIAWVDKGAPQDEYTVKDEKKKAESISLLFDTHGCTDCHSRESTMRHNMHDYPLEKFEQVVEYTKPNSSSMDTGRLLSLSHYHLIGMGMMFLAAGAAVALTLWPKWLRAALVVGGQLSILLDIFGWWGVKWYGAPLSPIVMAGGGLMAASFFASVGAAYWDLWIRKPKAVAP